ncbi:hypothetical protein BT96DRAFT_1012308 [Gymnopus androsaceus JB14]|uniref:Mug135-like C-terminal domain-containing protein n=1 Tax=Gymnopus androsaceus JB14 TaxID=1447944 RepID=A0A6A4INX9_9AGAR|nr:hypothetical protein BT96DRAFT_1012308 [Gymnopus androsaceus JB14]
MQETGFDQRLDRAVFKNVGAIWMLRVTRRSWLTSAVPRALRAPLVRHLSHIDSLAMAKEESLPQALEEALAPLKLSIAQLETDVTQLKENLTHVSVYYFKDRNSIGRMPDAGPFHEVPLPDGRRPWNLQVAGTYGPILLPPLVNVQAIQDLTPEESSQYFALYCPTSPLAMYPHMMRLTEIHRAIGRP